MTMNDPMVVRAAAEAAIKNMKELDRLLQCLNDEPVIQRTVAGVALHTILASVVATAESIEDSGQVREAIRQCIQLGYDYAAPQWGPNHLALVYYTGEAGKLLIQYSQNNLFKQISETVAAALQEKGLPADIDVQFGGHDERDVREKLAEALRRSQRKSGDQEEEVE